MALGILRIEINGLVQHRAFTVGSLYILLLQPASFVLKTIKGVL
jgi:hypothetical protein